MSYARLSVAVAVTVIVALSACASASMLDIYDEDMGDPYTMGELKGGQTFIVGDKLFSDFDWSTSEENIGGQVPGDGILVFPVQMDTSLGLLYGMFVQGGWTAGTVDAQTAQIVDTRITFRVTVLNDEWLIHNSLLMLWDYGIDGSGNVAITETIRKVLDDPPGGIQVMPIGTNYVYSTLSGPEQLADHDIFDETVREIVVSKDVVVASGPYGHATISGFYNVFSQVPEPGTMILLGLGSAILFVRRRKNTAT